MDNGKYEYSDKFLDWIDENAELLDDDMHSMLHLALDAEYGASKDLISSCREQLLQFLTVEMEMSIQEIVDADIESYPIWKNLDSLNSYIKSSKQYDNADMIASIYTNVPTKLAKQFVETWVKSNHITCQYFFTSVYNMDFTYITAEDEDDFANFDDRVIQNKYIGITRSAYDYLITQYDQLKDLIKPSDFKVVKGKHNVITRLELFIEELYSANAVQDDLSYISNAVQDDPECCFVKVSDLRFAQQDINCMGSIFDKSDVIKYKLPTPSGGTI